MDTPTSYLARISQISSKCSYKKLSRLWVVHQCAMMAPPRDTIPVRRFSVSGTWCQRNPAWIVK